MLPSDITIKQSNIYKFMQSLKDLNIKTYESLHKFSTQNYEDFWDKAVKTIGINFYKPYTKIHNLEKNTWFLNSKLNITDSCFLAKKNKTAIVYQDYNKNIKYITYGDLNNLVNKIANGIDKLNLKPNSGIAINMPMTVEACATYLAIIKSGHYVISIAESFAAEEIKIRLDIAKAKAIFCSDGLIRNNKRLPLYTKIIQAKAPKAIVIPISSKSLSVELRQEDISWGDFLSNNIEYNSKIMSPHDYTNILFSSGTTSTPKAIPWDHVSPIKAASDAYFHHDVKPNDIFAWPTSLGWMMGPWLIYAALINKSCIALFYDSPTSQEFLTFIEKSNTTILGLVPSLIKSWRKNNFLEDINLNNIKLLSSSGESSNSDDMKFIMEKTGNKPIIEYCGGTEISGAYITSTVIQENIPSTFSAKALGNDFTILDKTNEVALITPALGLSRTLLNKNHDEVYFKNMPKDKNGKTLRKHGDQIEQLKNGYYKILGRVDDTMNIGGIKISAIEIEQAIGKIPNILEIAAISSSPKNGGPAEIIIYAVPENNILIQNITSTKIIMQKAINSNLNPLFKIKDLIFIKSLPRTSSNKIMRRILKEQYIE